MLNRAGLLQVNVKWFSVAWRVALITLVGGLLGYYVMRAARPLVRQVYRDFSSATIVRSQSK